MTFKTSLVAACVVALLGSSSAAFAQAAAPAPAAAPAAAPAKPMKPMKAEKGRTAASMACSKDADSQNIHGKARKKFMRDCKKNGGTAPAQ